MKQTLHETYDEIHAPQWLIEETKTKVHKEMKQIEEGNLVNRSRHGKNGRRVAAEIVVAMAACVSIVILGKQMTKPKSIVPISDTKKELGQTQNDTKEKPNQGVVCGTIKLEQWKETLAKIKADQISEQALEAEVIVYEADTVIKDATYQVQVRAKDGVVRKQGEDYVLSANYFLCIEQKGTRLSSKQILLEDETLFTKEVECVTIEDDNKDGIPDYKIGAHWYTTSPTLAIIALE